MSEIILNVELLDNVIKNVNLSLDSVNNVIECDTNQENANLNNNKDAFITSFNEKGTRSKSKSSLKKKSKDKKENEVYCADTHEVKLR